MAGRRDLPGWLAVAAAAVAGALGPADPSGAITADTLFRMLAAAGAAWVVVRLLASSAERSWARQIARVIAAFGAGLIVASLDDLWALIAWAVVAVAVMIVGGPMIRSAIALAGVVALVVAVAGSISLVRSAIALDDAADATQRLEDDLLLNPEDADAGLGEVEGHLETARASLDAWWARPARAVPVLGHHLRLGDTALAASSAVVDAAGPVARTSLDDLVTRGRIDLEEMARLSGEIAVLAETADAGATELGAIDRDWLLRPAAREIGEVEAEFTEYAGRLGRIAQNSHDSLAYLGSDGPTRWFVYVCTPAEARARCGFPGNWVEIDIVDGRALLVDAGRTATLEEAAAAIELGPIGPADFNETYGQFEPVPVLRNITMTPDFPSTAEATADVLEAIGHDRPDVVAAVNTEGLEALLRVIGPVDAGAMGTLQHTNVRKRLDVEQYSRFETQSERVDALDAATRALMEQVTRLDKIDMSLLHRFEQPIHTGGFLAAVPGEPDNVFVDIGVDGAMPDGPLVGATVQNAAGNKLDAFTTTTLAVTPATADSGGCATFELALDSAPGDAPDYVNANIVGLPDGWLRSWVSIYTPTPVIAATLDGEPVAVVNRVEKGHPASSLLIDTPPRSSSTLELLLAAGATDAPEVLVQPSVRPSTVEITDTCD